MNTRRPVELFHPGEHLREELEARGWSQVEFANVIGRPIQIVNQIINGKKSVTAETAKEIGLALGTGPEIWINLQTSYDLWNAREPDRAIARRAKQLATA